MWISDSTLHQRPSKGILITAPLPLHHFHPRPSTFGMQITVAPAKYPFRRKKKYLNFHNQRERVALKRVKILSNN